MLPDYAPLRRSLALLRRLGVGPADRAALMAAVRQNVAQEAYGGSPLGALTKADLKRFENDLQRLRDLGVEIAFEEDAYRVVDLGDFRPLALTPRELNALAFVQEAFAPGAPLAEEVQQLVRRVANWLPVDQGQALSRQRQQVRVDLQRRDDDAVAPAVEDAIAQAVAHHRLLRFSYRTPGQADGLPRRHTVQPWSLDFDATRHHLYLDAYCVTVEGPYGLWRALTWQRYRLGRILAGDITVLPDKFPSIPPKRPQYRLEYLLAPEIARLGEISRHFDDMQIHPPDAEGWVRVVASTGDLFRGVRLLLGYGPLCRVVGGREARREMMALVRALGALYLSADADATGE